MPVLPPWLVAHTKLEARVTALESRLNVTQAETIELGDYTNHATALYVQHDIIGRGRDLTTYVLTGSTQQAYVDSLVQPAQGAGETNDLYAMRIGVGVGSTPKSPALDSGTLQGFTLDLSAVEHNTNGIQAAYVIDFTARDIRVKAVRGDASAPPGETFPLSLWHVGESGGSALLEGVEIDGAGIAATGLGLNDAWNVTSRGLVCKGARFGFGMAVWQCGGTHHHDKTDLRGNRKPVNHEQPRPGAVFTYVEPDCREQLSQRHFTFNGNLVAPAGVERAKLHIRNPKWDRDLGPFRVAIQAPDTTYNAWDGRGPLPQTCRPEDVFVTIDGVTYNGVTNAALCRIGPSAW